MRTRAMTAMDIPPVARRAPGERRRATGGITSIAVIAWFALRLRTKVGDQLFCSGDLVELHFEASSGTSSPASAPFG
ncbi:MAG: hypothetical protein IMX06_08080 [Kyrpidia tusciae]|nr:hypothetical protein [Kyrpidia tusciae]MBE3552800.1 hypothetical protein [Kyrpidia tusciae]